MYYVGECCTSPTRIKRRLIILGIISYLILFPINYILCSIRAEIEVMNYYKEKHIISDLFCVKSVIEEMYPDYLSSFDECLNSDNFYLANMIYA